MHRLAAVSLLIALGLACGPTGYQDPGFDTDYTNPDQNGPDETDAGDTSESDVGGGSNNGHSGPNNPPRSVAAADPDHGIVPPQSVTLDGSGSSDIDGDPLAYHWELGTKPTGSSASIANPTFAIANLYVDVPGVYTVQLTVTDGKAQSVDGITLNVANPNQAPTANAGPDLTVDVGTVVQLSGAASTDPEGDELEYMWQFITQPPGSTSQLQGVSIPGAAVSPSFVADAAGTFTVKLEVSDGQLTSRADLVNVVARPPSTGGTGGLSSSSSGSSSSCLSCAAQASEVASNTWSAGDLAGSFGLLVLPVFVALWQRRRED